MLSVLGELQDRFCSLRRIFFLHQQYLSRGGRPSEGQEVIALCLCEYEFRGSYVWACCFDEP